MHVAAAPQRVFDYLADPANRPAWQSSLRRVDDVRPGPGGVTAAGTTWTDVTMVPGLRPAMRTTHSDRPHRWAEDGTWGPFAATLSLELLPAAEGGTDVRVDFTVRALGAGRALSRLARRPVVADLQRAAALIEGG